MSKKKLNILAYEYIKNRIVNNEYKVNQILSEKLISEKLKISRTPVKEALSRLENESFVVINPRKSVSVTEVNLKIIKDIFQVRSKIEPLLVELTLSFMNRKDLEKSLLEFRKKFKEMSEKAEVSGAEFDSLYDSYRVFFAHNCGNFFFTKQMCLVYEHLHRIRKVLYGDERRRLEALNEHIEIIDAILNNSSFDIIKDMCDRHIEEAQIDFFRNLSNLHI